MEILEASKEMDGILVVRISWGNILEWILTLAVCAALLFFGGVWLGSRGASQAYKQGLLDGRRQITIERLQKQQEELPRERPALGHNEYAF